MNKTTSKQRYLLAFGIPLLLLFSLFIASNSKLINAQSETLSIMITLDLLLTIPFVYFLLIRKTSIPKTTIVPLLIIGLVVGTFILPKEHQLYLDLFKTWGLPVIELSILTYVFLKIRKTVAHFKTHKTADIDFFDALKATSKELMPTTLATLITMEIAVLYYGLIYWRKRILKNHEFTYYKNNGTITLLGALMFLILVETPVLHILLNQWNSVAAWIFTGLSAYSVIQLFGFIKSILKRPISIEGNVLNLRYGIIHEAKVYLDTIELIEWTSTPIEFDNDTRALSVLKSMEGHNVVIHLNKETTLHGFYGMKKTFKSIAFMVDNKNEFKKQLEAKLL